MEELTTGRRDVASTSPSELWGREVRDGRGEQLGTIDSIVQTFRGPTRAIVRSSARSPRAIFVDLAAADFDGDAVVVPWVMMEAMGAKGREVKSWARWVPRVIRGGE